MECLYINDSKDDLLITIAVQMHGKVIDLNLTPEKQNIFSNVRLYSQSGDFRDVLSTPIDDSSIINKLNEIFQKNLNEPSIKIINKYIEYMSPKYKSFLEWRASDEYNAEDRENVCREFSNIIFDKSFSTETSQGDNIFNCLFERLIPEFHGIFLISIHKKIILPETTSRTTSTKITNKNKHYELIYPTQHQIKNQRQNLNLLNLSDLKKFANIFNKDFNNFEVLKTQSFELPISEYLKREKAIEENNTFLKQEKKILLEQQKKEFFKILSNWNITIKNNKIESIKMSTLIKIIKDILSDNAYINLFDYSCNSITKYIPTEERYHTKYLQTSDIENPPNRSWGGNNKKFKNRKKPKTKKNKKNSKTEKNRKKPKKTKKKSKKNQKPKNYSLNSWNLFSK